MSKHFILALSDGHLEWARKVDHIRSEELLDGIYVVRTSEPTERLAAEDGVRSYERLALVEQAFRCVKGIDLLVRPIHHRTADRVRAHILPAGILRGVAPAAGVGTAPLRGRGIDRGPAATRPRGT